MADEPVKKLYCLWLPKGHRGKLVEVKRINKKVLKKLIGEIKEDTWYYLKNGEFVEYE